MLVCVPKPILNAQTDNDSQRLFWGIIPEVLNCSFLHLCDAEVNETVSRAAYGHASFTVRIFRLCLSQWLPT